MFSDKPYPRVNREERHYCALLLHAILGSKHFRSRTLRKLDQQLGTAFSTASGALGVFIEASILRDYWHELGSPKAAAEARRSVVETVLRHAGLPVQSIDKNDLFWTGDRGKSHLWYPGHWRSTKIAEADLSSAKRTELKAIQEAFRSVPDMLLHSAGCSLVVEAKVESGEGENQYSNLLYITRLLPLLVPSFKGQVVGAVLSVKEQKNLPQGLAKLYWRDIASGGLDADLDPFTIEGLRIVANWEDED